ncbi:sugar kinase [Streptomyces sp. NPDC047028]|uniref:sugar kinase n=1 Tax=Streptomyces sp. NPDC047028 TaxID=3155793 RepID=UPI0033DB4EE3
MTPTRERPDNGADLVCVGETLAVMDATDPGPLRHSRSFCLRLAGAEFNVAIGAARLGTRTAYIGRIGDDEPGRLVREVLLAEGVDARGLTVHPDLPTSLMVKEHRMPGVVGVTYYRRGNAGSTLTPADLDPALLRDAAVLHLSGITPALSASARATVFAAAEEARAARTLVSLDLNYRGRLWPQDEAAAVLRDLAAHADVVFSTTEEAALLCPATTPRDAAHRLAALGPREVVVKRGAEGAVALVDGVCLDQGAFPVREVDPTGAGDAFVAGYLAERIAGGGAADRLDLAARLGAFAVTQPGDWEGLPRRSDLGLVEHRAGTVLR